MGKRNKNLLAVAAMVVLAVLFVFHQFWADVSMVRASSKLSKQINEVFAKASAELNKPGKDAAPGQQALQILTQAEAPLAELNELSLGADARTSVSAKYRVAFLELSAYRAFLERVAKDRILMPVLNLKNETDARNESRAAASAEMEIDQTVDELKKYADEIAKSDGSVATYANEQAEHVQKEQSQLLEEKRAIHLNAVALQSIAMRFELRALLASAADPDLEKNATALMTESKQLLEHAHTMEEFSGTHVVSNLTNEIDVLQMIASLVTETEHSFNQIKEASSPAKIKGEVLPALLTVQEALSASVEAIDPTNYKSALLKPLQDPAADYVTEMQAIAKGAGAAKLPGLKTTLFAKCAERLVTGAARVAP